MNETTADKISQWEFASDATEDCIFILDTDMNVLNANKAMRSFLKKEKKDLIGKHCWELVHGAAAPPDFCPMKKVLLSKKRESTTIEFAEKFYRLTIDPILDEAGSLKGAIHILRDVDESERKNRQLEESTRKYVELVDTMFDVVFTLDFEGKVVDTSPSIKRITGRSREENIGRHFSEYVYPDDIEIAESEFIRAIQGIGHPIEIRIVPVDRVPRWVRINALLTTRNGEPQDLLCVLSDIHERKLMEISLLENQTILRETMKIAKIGGWEIDVETMTQEWTGGVFEIMDADPVKGPPKVPDGLQNIAEWCRPIAEKAIQRAIKHGEPFDHEWEVITLKGNRRWVRAIGKANEKNGKIVSISGSFQDITDMKRYEFRLMDAEGKYQSLSENMVDGYAYCKMLYDDQGRPIDFIYLQVNKSFEILTGLKSVVGKKVTDVIPGIRESNPEIFEIYSEVVKTGKVANFEVEVKPLSLWLTIAVYRPEIGHFIAIFSNFTERKHTEMELEKKTIEAQEKSYELSMMNEVSEIFLSHSDDDMFPKVLSILKKATRSKYGVFGYLDESGSLVIPSIIRMVWEHCQIPDKTSVLPRERLVDCSWSVAMQEKRPIMMNEPTTSMHDGNVQIARHISIPLIEKNEIIGLIQVANKDTDYTNKDLKLLNDIANMIAPVLSARLKKNKQEEELRIYRANLEQMVVDRTSELKLSNEELESFVYSVSHDLRAPLRSIDGFSQAVVEDYADKLDAQGQDYLNLIRDSTQRMGTLIDEMLMLSRISRAELKLDSVNLSAIAEIISKELKEGEPHRKVHFVIEPRMEVKGDRDLLRILMENLIGNAWKFTSKHESARIEIGRGNGIEGASIFVKDDGAGFDIKYVDKLFIPFQRLHSFSEFPGTGVGLATIQRIINKHGGKIWAEGAVEKGAIFHFTIGPEEQIPSKMRG
jgi:PAS domain S-box-containing protein